MEAGAGVGVVPETVLADWMDSGVVLVPLVPVHTVPLVMVWGEEGEDPPVRAFRMLVEEWLKEGKLWIRTSSAGMKTVR